MRQRRVRTPNRATANDKPIQRPDTYQRLPEDVQLNTCEQQPVHTFGLTADLGCAPAFHDMMIRQRRVVDVDGVVDWRISQGSAPAQC